MALSAISRMGGSATTSSRSVERAAAPSRPRSGEPAIHKTSCTCCATATKSDVYLFEAPSRDPTAGSGRTQPMRTIRGGSNARLTLNVGLRFDRYRVFLPEQTHPAGQFNPDSQTFPAIDNREGVEYSSRQESARPLDLTGDGRTVAKFSYGRYWLAPGTATRVQCQPERQPVVAAIPMV